MLKNRDSLYKIATGSTSGGAVEQSAPPAHPSETPPDLYNWLNNPDNKKNYPHLYSNMRHAGTIDGWIKQVPVFGKLGSKIWRGRTNNPTTNWMISGNNPYRVNNLLAYSKSPIMNALIGDYKSARDAYDFLDRIGTEGTQEYQHMRHFIPADQLKSYQRWRPLLAIWMNIRGWLRSLFTGNRFNSMSVSHPRQSVQQPTTPAPATV